MKVPVIVAIAVLAAGCGAGSVAVTKSSVAISSLETKAAMTACTSNVQPLTSAAASCTYGTGDVTLATFDTNSHRDLWVLASKTAEGGTVVEGNDWAAMLFDPDDATTLAATLGGKPG